MMYEYQQQQHSLRNFLYKVYAWMFAGLMVTAGIAHYIGSNPALVMTIAKSYLMPLMLVQLGIVFGLIFFLERMNAAVAALMFMLYAASVGVSSSVVFLAYTQESIYATFAITAGMFGAMAIYGYVTKTDLSSMGSILLMCLIGLILGGLVNLFLRSAAMQFVLSFVGVVVFTLLTAYDMQRIKEIGMRGFTEGRVAIIGALTLYLDFINLFFYLLQLTGRRKE